MKSLGDNGGNVTCAQESDFLLLVLIHDYLFFKVRNMVSFVIHFLFCNKKANSMAGVREQYEVRIMRKNEPSNDMSMGPAE